MAHWAELDENNVVIRVTVGDNDDPNGDEGYQWLVDNLGGNWVQTSYNATFGRKFAAIGDTYLADSNEFKPEQPFASWTFDETEWAWQAPIAKPNDEKKYRWDEEQGAWIEIQDA